MNLVDYKAYGLQIATRHKSILHSAQANHFTVFTAEDVLTGLKDLCSPVLAAELPRTGLLDNGSDNIHTIMKGAYLVLKKVDQGNSDEIIAAYEEMYVIAMDILTKMLNDRKLANTQNRNSPERLVKHLQLNSIELVDVGPVFDGYYGWRLDFPFQSVQNMQLDVNKWNSETLFTG
jgi:hypothetical protein